MRLHAVGNPTPRPSVSVGHMDARGAIFVCAVVCAPRGRADAVNFVRGTFAARGEFLPELMTVSLLK